MPVKLRVDFGQLDEKLLPLLKRPDIEIAEENSQALSIEQLEQSVRITDDLAYYFSENAIELLRSGLITRSKRQLSYIPHQIGLDNFETQVELVKSFIDEEASGAETRHDDEYYKKISEISTFVEGMHSIVQVERLASGLVRFVGRLNGNRKSQANSLVDFLLSDEGARFVPLISALASDTGVTVCYDRDSKEFVPAIPAHQRSNLGLLHQSFVSGSQLLVSPDIHHTI